MSAAAVKGGKSSGSGRLAAAQRFLERWGVAVAFVLLFAASTWMQGFDFLNFENFRTLLNSNAAVGILAVGMTFVIISGGIDLSVGSIVVLSAALGTTAMNHLIGGETAEGTAVLAAVGATLLAGLVAGSVNGSLVVFGRIAPFIATLGGLAAYRSMALAIAEAGEIRSASSTVFSKIGRGGIPLAVESTNEAGETVYRGLLNAAGKPLTVTYAILVFLAIAAIAQWFLSASRFGRHLVAVGANEVAARYAGIAVGWVRFRVYALMGLLAGVAGILQSSRMNSVSTSGLGVGAELDAIAAVVIGGTSLRGGFGRVWGTVIGVLILGMITNILTISGVSPYWQGAVKGGVIVLAVLVQRGSRE
ncbi:MAG: ABC transporter permease [Planctomycetaceae bacterium]|nr:ABC transporter permease [Planctomycetaceae bacterium]